MTYFSYTYVKNSWIVTRRGSLSPHDHTGTQGYELSEYIATKIDEIHGWFQHWNLRIHLKQEPMVKLCDINGHTHGNFVCLGEETNRAGIFQVRDIFGIPFVINFLTISFRLVKKHITKDLMNKLIDILFWWVTYSCYITILVSLRVYFDHFDLSIVQIVLSLVEWSPITTLRVNKITMLNRFRCDK